MDGATRPNNLMITLYTYTVQWDVIGIFTSSSA